MKGLNNPVFILFLFLLSGIFIGPRISVNLSDLAILFFIIAVLFVTMHVAFQILRKKHWVSGILAGLCFLAIGIITVKLNDPLRRENHYLNFIDADAEHSLLLSVSETYKPGFYDGKFKAEVLQIDDKPASGHLLLNLMKDTVAKDTSRLKNIFLTGQVLYTKASLQEIAAPKNPYQFSYAEYMAGQKVYRQIYVSPERLFLLPREVNSLQAFAGKIRGVIREKLRGYDLETDEWAVINALLLGQRQEISTELNTRYADAGMIHILAVSGLHVGIFMYLLQLLFRPLGNYKRAKIFRTVMIVFCIWGFALIAGLSPSILRAATMFSFIQIGLTFNHRQGALNALLFSAFFLLLFDPSLITKVGFQLSYLAVFFIVWLQPWLFRLWKPPNRFISFLWGIITVSLVAQLGVLPLSLYYFHQFPGLFLISNLVVIPFLGFILGFGILILLLASMDILPQFLADLYGEVISLLNLFVSWISGFESLVFKSLYFSLPAMIFAYLIIVSGCRLLIKYRYSRLILFLVAILSGSVLLIFLRLEQGTNGFYVFHKNRESLLAEKRSDNLFVYHHDTVSKPLQDTRILSLRQALLLEKVESEPLRNYYRFGPNKILVLDGPADQIPEGLQPDFIILRNSPKINLTRLLTTYPMIMIIADGSNYKSYVANWKNTCIKQKIPFHSTYEKGFYKIN